MNSKTLQSLEEWAQALAPAGSLRAIQVLELIAAYKELLRGRTANAVDADPAKP